MFDSALSEQSFPLIVPLTGPDAVDAEPTRGAQSSGTSIGVPVPELFGVIHFVNQDVFNQASRGQIPVTD